MAEPTSPFAYLLTQTRKNVELLMAHKQIPESDGADILSKLPGKEPEESAVVVVTRKTENLCMSPQQAGPPKVEVRATCAWTSENPNDLPFEPGEVIEVLAETNADWWTGRNQRGKQGLFPAKYVEKLPSRLLSPISIPEQPKFETNAPFPEHDSPERRYSAPLPPPRHPPQKPYPPTPAPPQTHYPPPPAPPQTHYPPPPAPPYPHYPLPPGYYPPAGPPPGAVAYSYTPPQQVKRSALGILGRVMVESAAGGVGLGAGAAIGNGIVNGIF